MAKVLKSADPARKAELYAGLGVQLAYRPHTRTVSVEASQGRVPKCVSEGGFVRDAHAPVLRGELALS